MADETNSEPVPSTLTAEDKENQIQVDPVGQSVLDLLRKAASLAGGNSQFAVDIALKMSDRLGLAESRVAALEEQVANLQVEVEFFREKSKRAEEWLNKISGEIQEQVSKTIIEAENSVFKKGLLQNGLPFSSGIEPNLKPALRRRVRSVAHSFGR